MKKSTNLLRSLLLAATVVLGCNAWAQSDYDYDYDTDEGEDTEEPVKFVDDGLLFAITSESTVEVAASENVTTELTIPATAEYEGTTYTVTAIGQQAFMGDKTLNYIHFPNTLLEIKDWAFRESGLKAVTFPNSLVKTGGQSFAYCEDLESVDFGSGIETIGASTFMCCWALRGVVIPNNVKRIESSAFTQCDFETIDLGQGVEYLGNSVFFECYQLKTLAIPASVTEIGGWLFMGCTAFEGVTVDANNPSFSATDGVLYDKEATVLLQVPNPKTEVAIPNTVKKIAHTAFMKCDKITHLDIPEGVEEFEDAVFYMCTSLKTINLPSTLQSMDAQCFYYCTALESLSLPDGLTYVPQACFFYCSNLTNIELGTGLESIADMAFWTFGKAAHVACRAAVPPVTEDSFTCFNKAGSSLTVPEQSLEAYKEAEEWKDFGTIEGVTTAINHVEAAAVNAPLYYDLSGKPVSNPENGVFVRVMNGKTQKVIRK